MNSKLISFCIYLISKKDAVKHMTIKKLITVDNADDDNDSD